MKHSAIMSPTDYCYFDYSQGDRKREPVNIGGYIPLAKAYGYEPVPMGLSADDASHILGAQANLWTEYIAVPDYAEYMLYPRLLAFSESVWSPASGKDYAISETHIFHLRDGKISEHWRDADTLGRMRQLGAV